jgi:hypothetical protein
MVPRLTTIRSESTTLRRFVHGIAALATPLVLACTANQTPAMKTHAANQDFGFYMISEAEASAPTDAGLTRRLLSLDDVESYDSESHEFVLVPNALTRVKEMAQPKLVGTRGLPFLVVAEGRPAYAGRFWTILSSERPSQPVILVESLERGKFVVQDYGQTSGGQDILNNTTIVSVMRRAGKLTGARKKP